MQPENRQLLQQARQAIAEHNYRDALRQLRPLLRGRPAPLPPAQLELTRALLLSGHLQCAARTNDWTLQRNPHSAPALLLSSRIALARGNPQAALARLEKLPAKNSEHPSTLLLRARCLEATGTSEEAAKIHQQLLEAPSDTPVQQQAANWLASYFQRTAGPEAALEHWQRLARMWPNSSFAQTRRGEILFDMQRTEEAAAAFEAALRLDPHSSEALLGFGECAFVQNNLAQAVSHLERALEVKPKSFYIRRRLASMLLSSRPTESVRLFREVLEQKPADTGATAGLIRALSDLGELTAAGAELRRARERDPQEPRWIRLQNALRASEGEFDSHEDLSWALHVVRDPTTPIPFALSACQLLLDYGIVAPLFETLERIDPEHRSRQAEDLRNQATQLHRAGLSIPPPSDPAVTSHPADLTGASADVLERFQSRSDTVVLFFPGALGRGAGFSLALWQRLLEQGGVSVIYLRDLRQTSGLLGYPSLGANFYESAQGLRQRVRASGAHRVLALGTSVGCTPALRYGNELGVDAVLGLGTILNIPTRADLPARFHQAYERVMKETADQARNIGQLYAEAASPPTTTLIYAGENERDSSHAHELWDAEGVRQIPIKNYVSHNVVRLLLSAGLLSRVVDEFLLRGELSEELTQQVSSAFLLRHS